MKKNAMNEHPLMNEKDGVVLFYPEVQAEALASVSETLSGRWIGQGPKVDQFEAEIKKKFLGTHQPLSVGSGTDALHLAYILAKIKPGDEVLVPVFTCTATNIPLLYLGAKIKFIDIDPLTMNISIADLESKISDKTKAIVTVDYGGICCDYSKINDVAKKYGIPVIQDAAHSIGSMYSGSPVGSFSDFTIFSFQAIKTLTTGDGGLLSIKNSDLTSEARRIRWFGIDRESKQGGIWENDIREVGYKYQMNDIAAAIGLANLKKIDESIAYRKNLFKLYDEALSNINGVKIVKSHDSNTHDFCPWLLTIIVDENRVSLMNALRSEGVESAQVHYRNDRYSIFGGRDESLPNMDSLEDKYLVLPLHSKVTSNGIEKIKHILQKGW